MKVFFVLLLATAIVSVTLADLEPVSDIQREQNSSFVPAPRIIQGTLATNGQFPYQEHLTIYSVEGILFGYIGNCGGSIIHTNWVITAAHCTVTPLLIIHLTNVAFKVKVGSVDVDILGQTTTVLFLNVHTHPNYDKNSLMNDIALLKTQEPFEITPNVAPIALVPENTDLADYVGQSVTISGFGLTTNNGSTSKVLLYSDTVKIIPFTTCETQYGGSLPTTCFCVEDTTPPISATCSGDSGGPVTMIMDDVRSLIGVVSFVSIKGCDASAQGETDVAPFVLWIRQVTGLPL